MHAEEAWRLDVGCIAIAAWLFHTFMHIKFLKNSIVDIVMYVARYS